MDQNLDNLREALKFSPDNIPLRLHLADSLLNANELLEAQEQYQLVLSKENNSLAKLGLAKICYRQERYSQCMVILEEMIDTDQADFEALLLGTKALVKENSIPAAIEMYQRVLAINPGFSDPDLDAQLRVATSTEEASSQGPGADFVERPQLKFSDVGGMESIKKEIDAKIIQPLRHPDIYKAYGKKIGGGILLYGPPGCGKTYLAKATAGQVNARFASITLNEILDMWIGSSEKNLHQVFEIARSNTPCVLFFDEIDALGASRSDMKQSAGRHLINQFLMELDSVESDNEGLLVLGATNTPWHLDAAFRRPGRFDRIIFVPPPDREARALIFELKLAQKPTEDIDFQLLAKKTNKFSGADIEAVVDIAIEGKLEQAIAEGVPKPLTTKDLQKAIKKHKPTTSEWFSTAKNFALYANESGLYDEILKYLKINK